MLKKVSEYFEGNTSEVNADQRNQEDILSKSTLRPANIKQIGKQVLTEVDLMLLKPEKVLGCLVREKKLIEARVLDISIQDEAVYFALQQPKTQ